MEPLQLALLAARRRSAPPAGAAAGRRRCSAPVLRDASPRPAVARRGPPGLDRAWSSAPHEGVARDLVGPLKFRRLLPVAEVMAERIQWLAPGHLLSGAMCRSRRARAAATPRLRSGGELAAALASRTRPRSVACLARRGRAIRSAAAAPSASASRRRSSHHRGPPQRHAGRRRPDHRGHPDRLRRRASQRRSEACRRADVHSAGVGGRLRGGPSELKRGPSELRPGRLVAARAGCGRHETPGT